MVFRFLPLGGSSSYRLCLCRGLRPVEQLGVCLLEVSAGRPLLRCRLDRERLLALLARGVRVHYPSSLPPPFRPLLRRFLFAPPLP